MYSKLRSIVKELGLTVSILYLIDRVLKKISSNCGLITYFFYDQPLKSSNVIARKQAYEFVWIEHVNNSIRELPRPDEVLNERFRSGSKCLVAKKAETGEFLGCAWFAFKHYQEDEVNCIYDFSQTSKVWDYDVYIIPTHRMSRLFLRLWQNAESSLFEEGYTSSLSRISAYNAQSIQSHEKFGAKRCGWAIFLKIFKTQIMLSSRCPYVSLSINKTLQPTFVFQRN